MSDASEREKVATLGEPVTDVAYPKPETTVRDGPSVSTPDAAAQPVALPPWTSVSRWHVVDRSGWVIADSPATMLPQYSREKAEALAAKWDTMLPSRAPHRAVRLAVLRDGFDQDMPLYTHPTPPRAASPEPEAVDTVRECDYWKPIAPGGIALPCNCGMGCDGLRAAAPRATQAEPGAVEVLNELAASAQEYGNSGSTNSMRRLFAARERADELLTLRTPSPRADATPCARCASAWPADEVVRKLVDAADILLDRHNYDGHGWELLDIARKEARVMLAQPRADATSEDREPHCTADRRCLSHHPCAMPQCAFGVAEVERIAASLQRRPPADATAGGVDINTPMPEHFREYVERNYPPGVVIHNPVWHASKLWGAALYALRAAKPETSGGEG